MSAPLSAPPGSSSATRSWFARLIPGGCSVVRGLWLAQALAAAGMVLLLKLMHQPSAKHLAKRAAEGKLPTFQDYLEMGLHRGAIVFLILAALVLATVRWWGRREAAVVETRCELGARPSRWFWPLLLGIVLLAGVLRWPRMAHSYWGDEGWAVREYVLGEYVPVSGKDMQGPLKFLPVSWPRVFFDDHTAGNHMAFSILQRLTLDAWRALYGLPPDRLDETISRLPPLAAGLGSLIAAACLFRWLGRGSLGLITALLLALHPWHLRYSTEARGYSLMFFFLVLVVWTALLSLRTGRWRWWLAFAAAEFLCMYSWKGIMYGLVPLNVCLAAWLLWGRSVTSRETSSSPATKHERWSSIARLLTMNVMAGALFSFLAMPSALQIKDAKERLVQLKGKPMDGHWLRDSLSGVSLGLPWDHDDRDNPTEVVMSDIVHRMPWLGVDAIATEVLLLLVGIAVWLRRSAWQAALWLGVLLSAVPGVLIFNYLIHAEWIYWYSFFIVLPLIVFKATAIDSLGRLAICPTTQTRVRRLAAGLLALGLPSVLLAAEWPHIRLMQTQAYERHREAWQLTRGQHEPLGYTGPSKVYTRYLWRYIHLYDPRSDGHIRDAAAMNALIAKVEAEKAEFYFTVGQRGVSRHFCPEVIAMLENPDLFEPIDTLWAEQEIHTLAVYRYKRRSR